MSPTDDSPDLNDTDIQQQREKHWKAVNDPDTTIQDLEIIISAGCLGLVRRAAEHPQVTLDVIIALSQHEDPEVRAAVVDHHQTSADLHWRLATDDSADVRYAIAESYLVDMDVISSLLEDANPYVSHRARTTLKKRNIHLLVAAEIPELENPPPANGSDHSAAH